jgi:hypothetical protein
MRLQESLLPKMIEFQGRPPNKIIPLQNSRCKGRSTHERVGQGSGVSARVMIIDQAFRLPSGFNLAFPCEPCRHLIAAQRLRADTKTNIRASPKPTFCVALQTLPL